MVGARMSIKLYRTLKSSPPSPRTIDVVSSPPLYLCGPSFCSHFGHMGGASLAGVVSNRGALHTLRRLPCPLPSSLIRWGQS